MQNGWNGKEKQLEQRELRITDECNKRCDALKEEYERLVAAKMGELNSLREQADDRCREANEARSKHRKELDVKEAELRQTRVAMESVRGELDSCHAELKQMRARFETFKRNERESHSAYEKRVRELESEADKLTGRCLDLTKASDEWQARNDVLASQLKKYEQLIDTLNEQLLVSKRESADVQARIAQAKQSCEADAEAEWRHKHEAKSKELEQLTLERNQLAHKCQASEDESQRRLAALHAK